MTTESLADTATTTDAASQDVSLVAQAAAEHTQATATANADTPPAAESDKPAEVPADYQPFTLPEGVQVDEEMLGEFKAVAKDLKLSQEQAQRLADLQAKSVAKQQESLRSVQAQWAEQSKSDKEFGGDNLKENLGVAEQALNKFAPPELRQLLKDTGLANHPDMIRTFVRVGKAISEDSKVVAGTRAAAVSLDPAKRLYPGMT